MWDPSYIEKGPSCLPSLPARPIDLETSRSRYIDPLSRFGSDAVALRLWDSKGYHHVRVYEPDFLTSRKGKKPAAFGGGNLSIS